jgi:cell division protease FtsH
MYAMRLSKLENEIKVALAGHFGVRLVTGDYWTGGLGDFENVRNRVWALYYHGAMGFPQKRIGTDEYPKDVGQEAKLLIDEAKDEVVALLTEKRNALDALTEALLEKEDLSGEEVVEIVEKANE